MYFAGVTVGGLLFGVLADRWGRRVILLSCLYAQGILGASSFFVSNITSFIVLRVFQGFFTQGLQGSMYTLMQELTPPRHLTFTGMGSEFFWATGLIYLGIVSYFVEDWRLLQVLVTLPTVVTLAWVWLTPESPKWYLCKEKKTEMVNQVMQIARRNKDEKFFEEINREVEESSEAVKEEPVPAGRMIEIFTNKILLKHILVMILVWYSVSLSYYGILLFMPNLAGSELLNL